MLLKNIQFAFSQALYSCRGKIFLSFLLHFIMSVATVVGIALISLGARLTLNGDTEFLVRSLRIPAALIERDNIYFVFGAGFVMLMTSVLFSFIARKIALDVESDTSSMLTVKLRKDIVAHKELYRIFLFQKNIDSGEVKKVISSGVRIIGGVVRIGLYQSANLIFLLVTALILLTYSVTVAVSLLVVTVLFLFILLKRSEKAREIESELKDTKLEISKNCRSILDSSFQPITLEEPKNAGKLAEYKKLDSHVGKTIGILDSSRLIFGVLLSAYFVLLILYIFMFGIKDKEILFPIIFLVIVVRQYAVSAIAVGVYLIAVSRMSNQILMVDKINGEIRDINERVSRELREQTKISALKTPDFISETVFYFANDAEQDSWTLRIAAMFDVSNYSEFQYLQQELQTQKELMRGTRVLEDQSLMHTRKIITRLKWQLPRNFSTGLCLDNENFKPAYIRTQALLISRLFSSNYRTDTNAIFMPAAQYVQLRQDVKDIIQSELDKPVIVFGRWSNHYLKMTEFTGGYFLSEKLNPSFIDKDALQRMKPEDIRNLYRQEQVEDIALMDTMGL